MKLWMLLFQSPGGLSKVSGGSSRNCNFRRSGSPESVRHHRNMTHWLHWTQHWLCRTSIRRLSFFLQLCHFTIFHSTDLHSSCTNTSTFQHPLNSPLHWKASLRLSNTSANHRTSFTSCITYSGSTPGAPTRWDVSPMLLRGLEFLELRPISQVFVDPADRDPVWCLERCRGRPWVSLVPPPPLLLLFRSIPAATPAATLYRGYSRPASPWTHQAALFPGWLKGERWVKMMMCVVSFSNPLLYFKVVTELLKTCYTYITNTWDPKRKL